MLECGLKSDVIKTICRLIRSDIAAYSSENNPSLLQHTKPEQLLDFSLPNLLAECGDKVPTLLHVITTATNRDDSRPVRKDFVAVTKVAKILSTYDRKFSLSPAMLTALYSMLTEPKTNVLIVWTAVEIPQMPQTLRLKLTEMAVLTTMLTRNWDIPRAASSIVFDVNLFVKPRHQTHETAGGSGGVAV